ncbi:MAG TPA: cell division topological specificity factor MinE [Anaerolineae bacterium]|nr:cell division topological specificity factor MinE [Anaerolineae bacterium]
MRFLQFFRKSKSPSSRDVAKERLQLVLVHDRTQISPALMQILKDEIIAVISKHVPIDREAVDISFTHSRRESRLQANIPLQPRSRQGAAH